MNTNTNTSFLAIALAAWSDGNGNPINPPNKSHLPIYEVLDIDPEASTINGTVVAKETVYAAFGLELWKSCGYGQDKLRLQADISRLSRGYISSAHEIKSNAGSKPTAASDTFVTTKRVVSAEEYLHNAITLNFNAESVASAMLDTYSIVDKTTKAELLALVQQIQALLLPADTFEMYTGKALDEAEAAEKFATLTDSGFFDIQSLSVAGRYAAKLAIADLGNIPALLTSFELVGSVIPLPSGKEYQITFKDKELIEE